LEWHFNLQTVRENRELIIFRIFLQRFNNNGPRFLSWVFKKVLERTYTRFNVERDGRILLQVHPGSDVIKLFKAVIYKR